MPIYAQSRRLIQEIAIRQLLDAGFKNRLSDVDLLDYKTSDTVFILGSGSSINELTEREWNQINENDSIGLNFWLTHDFVPTFYVYELSKYESDRETFYQLLDYKEDDYSDVPFIMKDTARTFPHCDPTRIPDTLLNNTYLCKSIRIPWKNMDYEVFTRSLHWFNKREYFSQGGRISCGLQKRASISFLIFLAMNMGYDKIVLCGVDMNDSKYFYEEERDKYERKGVPLRDMSDPDREESQVHRTNDPAIYRPIFENVLYKLNDKLLCPNGVELYTSSTSSAIHPKIPKYDFE